MPLYWAAASRRCIPAPYAIPGSTATMEQGRSAHKSQLPPSSAPRCGTRSFSAEAQTVVRLAVARETGPTNSGARQQSSRPESTEQTCHMGRHEAAKANGGQRTIDRCHQHRLGQRGHVTTQRRPCGPVGFGIPLAHFANLCGERRHHLHAGARHGPPKPGEASSASRTPRVRQGGGTTDVPVQPTFSQRLVAFTTPGLRSERPLALRGIAADKLRRRQMMGFLVSCHI